MRAFSYSYQAALAVFAAGIIASATDASGAVVYSELFGNSGAAKNFTNAGIGWDANVGSTATDQTSTSDTSGGSPAVVWNTNGQGGTLSYGFSAGSTIGLFWTDEFAAQDFDLLTEFSFYHNNSNTTTTLRLALRLDNNTPLNFADDIWVASNAGAFRTSGTPGSSGNWATNGEFASFSFTTAGSSWRDLTFTPGSALAVAGSARSSDLPDGNVNAAGILFVGSGGVRVDTFQISAVPEPSAGLLAASAMLGWSVCGRRRIRS